MSNRIKNKCHTAYQRHQENGSRKYTQSLHERCATSVYSLIAELEWLILHIYHFFFLLFRRAWIAAWYLACASVFGLCRFFDALPRRCLEDFGRLPLPLIPLAIHDFYSQGRSGSPSYALPHLSQP